ncbi:MAG: biotin/acetyl-CoA-carboxylase ligase [Planctomycetaceae bacterium]|nr:biotin/acetyl-CoA-carboxylase ligase [Planctomycetaceae bacterium]
MSNYSKSAVHRICQDTFIRSVEFYPELGSTNDRALDLATAESPLELPVLVWALKQTTGRGRGANRWWTAEGALTFSIILDTQTFSLPMERWPLVSLTTGLAVGAALQDLIPHGEIGLKWPNDVFLYGKKVCGILVEIPPRQAGKLVIGIGINVNNSLNGAPDDLQSKATALCDVWNRAWDLENVLTTVLRRLDEHLQQLSVNDPTLAERWHGTCVLRGRTVQHSVGERMTTGVCQGVDRQGALLLQTETGLVRVVGGVISRWD